MEQLTRSKAYLSEVQSEMRKVVWPTRKETSQTTIVVFAMVVAVSLFLWLIDAILSSIVQSVIG
uniref:Protein translocase subunit SecE n=1 Tax=Magnetococcus massalia (strain MO-1) TaxID=451514 RepID=A0A1S7LJW6_MAGMO|nr:Preprotein translocase subunit SecE (partial) [Candidatus Magnetococcus massalia]